MPHAHAATEEQLDTLREGRFHIAPALNHVLAMHLLALEWAEDVLIARFAGVRGPREIAAEAKARLQHAALVRSYGRAEPAPVAGRQLAVAA